MNSADTTGLLREGKSIALLRDYRNWLKSELQILGNASHHAYSFGQANMAKRAIEELDKETAQTLYISLDRGEVERSLADLGLLEERGALLPGLGTLREALRAALAEGASVAPDV